MQYEKKDEFGQVCRDFDEMRAYLQESVQQRLKDEKRRRDLITGISHDLRTPLTTIMGYLDGLLDGIADTPEKRQRYLQAIKTKNRESGEPGRQPVGIQQAGCRFPLSHGRNRF